MGLDDYAFDREAYKDQTQTARLPRAGSVGREYRFQESKNTWLGVRVCVYLAEQMPGRDDPLFAAYSPNPEDAQRAARQFAYADDKRRCEEEEREQRAARRRANEAL